MSGQLRFDGKVVIVTGFQGIDDNGNITTLGRGGSDTSAVAIAAAMKAAGIILRDFSSKPGLDNSIRITIGYQGEMDAVLAVLLLWRRSLSGSVLLLAIQGACLGGIGSKAMPSSSNCS